MKLADLATGPDWTVWIIFGIFTVLSIVLLSGHGSWFISGYNTASKEEKEKYDEKKLCRTMGDRKSTRLNSSHIQKSRMPSSA